MRAVHCLFVDLRRCLRGAWAMNEPVSESPKFSYLCRIEDSESDLAVEFDLNQRDISQKPICTRMP